jgi:hypothetical protein
MAQAANCRTRIKAKPHFILGVSYRRLLTKSWLSRPESLFLVWDECQCLPASKKQIARAFSHVPAMGAIPHGRNASNHHLPVKLYLVFKGIEIYQMQK